MRYKCVPCWFFLLDHHHTEGRDQFYLIKSLLLQFNFSLKYPLYFTWIIFSYRNVIKLLSFTGISQQGKVHISHCWKLHRLKSTLQLSWAKSFLEPEYFLSPRDLHLLSNDLATSKLLHKNTDLVKCANSTLKKHSTVFISWMGIICFSVFLLAYNSLWIHHDLLMNISLASK